MGKILPSYKKSLLDEFVDNISSGSSNYYAFASHPIEYTGAVPDIIENDFEQNFKNNWYMLFGKKIAQNNIALVINNIPWTSNTVYQKYDNTVENLENFYVITEPDIIGGFYDVYKCIDNSNGAVSTVDPSTIGTPRQPSTFETSDGYKWRYLYTISTSEKEAFSSDTYFPVKSNTSIVSTSNTYSGVDVVMISNSGSGFTAYTNGTVQSVVNTTVVQVQSSASSADNFYTNSAIYIYNTLESTSQLRLITNYISNSSGKFVVVSNTVNTSVITPGITNYLISPAVIFESDGDSNPSGYSLVNATSNYSLSDIVILNPGSNISWANVRVQAAFGGSANLYCIVPPPGGHGNDPASELNVKGFSISFEFANNESNTIPTSNIVFNKIGIIKNPYSVVSNTAEGTISKDAPYTANLFSSVLKANVSPSYTFSVGEEIRGVDSGALATVVFANSTQVYLTGDQTFIDGEFVANTSGLQVTQLLINNVGDIYTKDLKPIYIENINNVNRTDSQTESFVLTIEI